MSHELSFCICCKLNFKSSTSPNSNESNAVNQQLIRALLQLISLQDDSSFKAKSIHTIISLFCPSCQNLLQQCLDLSEQVSQLRCQLRRVQATVLSCLIKGYETSDEDLSSVQEHWIVQLCALMRTKLNQKFSPCVTLERLSENAIKTNFDIFQPSDYCDVGLAELDDFLDDCPGLDDPSEASYDDTTTSQNPDANMTDDLPDVFEKSLYQEKYEIQYNRSTGIFRCGTCFGEFTYRRGILGHIKRNHVPAAERLKIFKSKNPSRRIGPNKYLYLEKYVITYSEKVKRFFCGLCRYKHAIRPGIYKHIRAKHMKSDEESSETQPECDNSANGLTTTTSSDLDPLINLNDTDNEMLLRNRPRRQSAIAAAAANRIPDSEPEDYDDEITCEIKEECVTGSSDSENDEEYNSSALENTQEFAEQHSEMQDQSGQLEPKKQTKAKKKYKMEMVETGPNQFLYDGRIKCERVNGIYKCCACNTDWPKMRILQSHIETWHFKLCSKEKLDKSYEYRKTEDGQFKCLTCSMISVSMKQIRAHIKDVHVRGIVHKHQRSKEIKPGVFVYREHQYTNNVASQQFHCGLCGRTADNHLLMKRHIMRCHIHDSSYICDICGKELASKITMKNHMDRHAGNAPKNFMCTECGKLYLRKDDFMRHMRTHMEGDDWKKFICEFCGKKFGRKSQMEQHRQVHTGESIYGCQRCPQRFRLRKKLKDHERQEHSESFGSVQVKAGASEVRASEAEVSETRASEMEASEADADTQLLLA